MMSIYTPITSAFQRQQKYLTKEREEGREEAWETQAQFPICLRFWKILALMNRGISKFLVYKLLSLARWNHCKKFFHQHPDAIIQKIFQQPWVGRLKNWIMKAITLSILGQQHIWWHHWVDTIATLSTILHKVVTLPNIKSYPPGTGLNLTHFFCLPP